MISLVGQLYKKFLLPHDNNITNGIVNTLLSYRLCLYKYIYLTQSLYYKIIMY